MDEFFTVAVVVGILFLGLPWLILHHVTKWKTAATLTNDDERMLGDMYELARRLEDRMETVERLVKQDNPDFNPRRIDHETEDYVSENIRRLERNR
jgi:phage shock protein B